MRIISDTLESLQSSGSVVQKINLSNVPKSFGQLVPNEIGTEQIRRIDTLVEFDVLASQSYYT